MIKLYFLAWDRGCIKAYFTYCGFRYLSLVSSQNGIYSVTTGSKATHDFVRHELSEAQSAAVDAFKASDDYSVEYAAPIL